MLLSATYLLEQNPHPTEEEIRRGIQGNICRCTGYVNIVEAIRSVAEGGVTLRRLLQAERTESRARRTTVTEQADRARGRLRRHVDPAQGGQSPGPGRGRLRRRRQASRHGLRPLRPLAVRARAHRLGRRLGGGGARGRLRDADAGRGRRADRSVLRADDAARATRSRTTRSRSARCATSASQSSPSSPRRASSPATPPISSRSSTSRSTCSSTPARRRTRARPFSTTTPGTNVVWSGVLRLGRRRRRAQGRRPRDPDHGAALRPLLVDAARVLGGARRVRPRHGAVHDPLEPPDAGCRGDLDGTGAARAARQAALRLAGHRRRLRQQDHDAHLSDRLLPARAQAAPPDPVDGVAHRPALGKRARQRALVLRGRGRGHERRHDARLQGQGARRLRRLPSLRAARLHHLGAGHAGSLPVAQHPRRLHAGGDEQVAGGAEPRLLADAAALADGADRRHRRARARPRPGRGAGSATTSAPTRCRTRPRTAACTTPATTRAASTSRST